MNGAGPPRTLITDSGRPRSSGKIRPGHRVQVVHQVPLGRARPVEQRLVQVGQRYAVPFGRCHAVTYTRYRPEAPARPPAPAGS